MATIDRIGNYQILGTLGKGAHSTILHVRRQDDSREYALKMVSIADREELKFLEQARHEFRISQKLGHPNLIKVHCLETRKNWLFRVKGVNLLIEYVNGKTLDMVPPLPMAKLVPILGKISMGLLHMHHRGIYHADLKPNNIMLSKRGEVKILDYGLAHVKGEKKDRIQGTPEYMAPETATDKIVNEKTDIFNFGATMYRLITLTVPPNLVGATDSKKMMEKAWKKMLKPVEEINANVPKALCDLVHQCLAFYPDRRPERMGEVYEILKEIADELGEPFEGGTDPGV
ncbi:MAG: serine/threonine protein kinase [Planctomycetes bacterium]|nr:serine/threonine protein kinase [Planctomycetota bacterium]